MNRTLFSNSESKKTMNFTFIREPSLRELIIQNIRAYHSCFSYDYLKGLNKNQLIPLMHPIDREDYMRKIYS